MTAMLYGMAADGFVFRRKDPLLVTITAYFPIPSKATKAERAMILSGGGHVTSKPDADNIAKIILDALNGIAYEDDAQVEELTVRRRYAAEPCVRVTIETIQRRRWKLCRSIWTILKKH